MEPQGILESSILFQNDANTVFLVDVPTSLTQAQGTQVGTNAASSRGTLYSVAPPEAPYPSAEPRAHKRDIILQQQHNTGIPNPLLEDSLAQIVTNVGCRLWCLPRHVFDAEAMKAKGRRDQAILDSMELTQAWSVLEPLSLPAERSAVAHIGRLQDRLVRNEHPYASIMHIQSIGASFRIPPFSRFVLSSIAHETSMAFSMAALEMYPTCSQETAAESGQFDVIVMDPPWPNRSVRRSRKYQMLETGNDPISTLQTMLGQHIACSGFVTCWVTNNTSSRESALEMFREWNVKLIEEWVWLKVTTRGQPITALDGVWRKPYEVLLIGRKSTTVNGDFAPSSTESCHTRMRRTIAAVPDLHSRKPNLKEFIERFLLKRRNDYRALEVFARNLTAGWCAWGDEVLKYNDTDVWYDDRPQE